MNLFSSLVSTAHAQTTCDITTTANCVSSGLTSLSQVEGSLNRIVAFLFNTFWVVAVGMLIWAAILFLTAGDNKETIEKAKKMILYAVIAAAAALLASGIYSITYNVLQGK